MAAPKFFKIILDSKTDNLSIPPEFAKKYGHNLSNYVLLKVPTGSLMAVELFSSDGKTLIIRKGWKEFRERYSIGFGHFLVFQHNGKSEFNVAIFDKTGVEINYVHAEYKRGDRIIVKADNQENTTHAAQQIHSSCYRRGSNSKSDCKVKIHHQSTNGGDVVGKQLSTKVQMQSMQRVVIKKETSISYQKAAVIKKETSITYQKAAAFASNHMNPKKNPFHISLMHNSYVSYGFKVSVPFTFARQSLLYIGENSVSMVVDGKRWSMKCLVSNGRAFLSGGWGRFAMDNGIKVGDVCIFEVAEMILPPIWNVVIFRS